MDTVLGAIVEMMSAAGTRTIDCEPFSNGYVACAPAYGPSGESPSTPLYEDGSRCYGAICWDPDEMRWRRLVQLKPALTA